jgi:Sec-independent protein secretion pathway component TatC
MQFPLIGATIRVRLFLLLPQPRGGPWFAVGAAPEKTEIAMDPAEKFFASVTMTGLFALIVLLPVLMLS